MTNRVITNLTFSLINEIGGEGANSKSYLAHDPQLDAQIVVKQIPKSQFVNEDKYYSEAQILYGNKHPNIMEIKYACEDDDNIYFSMPYHINGSLNSLMNKRFLSVKEIIKYSLDFLSGLHYIHTQELIHFDIKPTNIIIDASNRALLTDFGLSEYITQEGFASPEQIYEKHFVPDAFIAANLTSQFDIYQAGLTLYRMCNGNEDFNSQSIGLTKDKITKGIFPSRTYFLPHIPKKLRRCIKKAIEVDPDRRYKTVLEFMNDLSSINDNLDWFYSCDDNLEEWILENENTTNSLILKSEHGKWMTEGYKTSKKTERKSRITKYFAEYASKELAYNEISKFLKEN